MSDTPRVDDQMESPDEATVPIAFARMLEREVAALEARLANSIDQNDLLAALTRRGFNVSGIDGDESPEDILANWVASEIHQLQAENERLRIVSRLITGET